MAVFKISVGSCTGKGFAEVNPDGYLKHFLDWINSGDSGWVLWDDQHLNPNYYIVICDDPSPTVNKVASPLSGLPPKFIQIGYNESGVIYISTWMWWNNATHSGVGLWDGRKLNTVDAGAFGYDFRGGDECMMISTIVGSSIHQYIIDEFVAIPGLLEDKTKVTVTNESITASGSPIVVGVSDTGVFSNGKYYFITDFSSTTARCDYVLVTNVGVPAGKITISHANNNYAIGSIIGAYPHRCYIMSTYGTTSVTRFSSANLRIPYQSYATKPMYNILSDWIKGACGCSVPQNVLSRFFPNEQGLYGVIRPGICEITNEDSFGSAAGMSRMYGITKNVISANNSGLVPRVSTRVVSGTSYLYIGQFLDQGYYTAFFILNTESV